MTRLSKPALVLPSEDIPFENGDRMTREEFHAAYLRTPEGFKAELIGGIVYVASPLKHPHAMSHPPLTTAFFLYQMSTPGVECGDNATIELGEDSEPQPDLYLRLLPGVGGQTEITEPGYIRGAPELVVEIALSSRSIDLHRKRDDYRLHGVKEYLVHIIRDQQLRWFDLTHGEERAADADGIIRLGAFPGLWLHHEALVSSNWPLFMSTLNQGLAAPEHAAFVAELARRRDAKPQ